MPTGEGGPVSGLLIWWPMAQSMSCHRYTLALAVMLLAGLAACGSTSSRGSGGIAKVDNLKSWVERVQAESERSKERVRTAVDPLDAVIAANYEDEVAVAYRKFRNP